MSIRPAAEQPISEIPLNVVGGCTFGRDQRISAEATWNMTITDGWLVNGPGYKKVLTTPGSKGRGIYTSTRGNFMLAVVGNSVIKISGPKHGLVSQQIITLNSFSGDVTIDENLSYQIAICDGVDLWIYNWNLNTAVIASIPSGVKPGFVTYHDTYFIIPDNNSGNWYLSAPSDGTSWLWGAGSTPVFSSIQTKPDFMEAVLRAPGKGSLIYVFGQNVTEMFNDVGNPLFPYQRNSSVSIDYGCISSNTIATMDSYVAFLGVNEKAAIAIMISDGGPFERISTDGIDFKLDDLVNPAASCAFFMQIDGHVIYQVTFFDPRDNFTLIYDFNVEKFFYRSDENLDYHIAQSVAFYNDTYYFVSLNDGDIYEFSNDFTTYNYTNPSLLDAPIQDYIIPRKRICSNCEQADGSPMIGNSLTFLVDQGNDPYFPSIPFRSITTEGGTIITTEAPTTYVGSYITTEVVIEDYIPSIDLSLSYDYGYTFSSPNNLPLNPQGDRRNRVVFWGLGACNSITAQLDFISRSSVTVSDGIISVRVMENG